MAEYQDLDPAAALDRPLTISEATSLIKELLEGAFPSLWLAGEISNFSRPQSGHCYFTLKDDRAQMRAVLWRSTANRAAMELHDGLEVVCRGHVDVYAPRGSYQLVVDKIEPQGIGALELALRKLREKLAAEGLFDAERKQPLPPFPRKVAFVTSPTGAAIRDFLEVLRRRWHGVEVLIIPTRVQGQGAAREIAAGIETAHRLATDIDVLVVGRGGGSLEDLWCFNEEVVVRAIAASRIPIISAVGHEIDVTLSDLAADVRALTPSEAAERLLPAAEEVRGSLQHLGQRLVRGLESRVRLARAGLDRIADSRVFRRPLDRVHEFQRRLDELQQRVSLSQQQLLATKRQRLERLAGKLDSLSPLHVLQRGYSVTQLVESGKLVRSSHDVAVGDQIATQLSAGQIVSRIEQIRNPQD